MDSYGYYVWMLWIILRMVGMLRMQCTRMRCDDDVVDAM